MGEKLKSPPLIEALCEFRFAGDPSWDWVIPGQLYDKIGQEFSERAQIKGLGVLVEAAAQEQPIATIHTGPERVQLKRKDGSAMVQVGPHLLAVNHLRPYPNWETFADLVMRIFGVYRTLAPQFRLERVGLRYINQIDLPKSPFQMKSLITLAPPLTGALDRPLKSYYQRYEIEQDNPKGLLIHQTGIRVNQEDALILVLDLDFGSTQVQSLEKIEDVRVWLDTAHDRVYEAFVSSLNPQQYEKMKRGRE